MSDKDSIHDKLDALQRTLQELSCPEQAMAELTGKVRQLHVLVYPVDGSAGLVARLDALKGRMDQLEKTREVSVATRRQVMLALFAAGASLVASALKLIW